MNSKRIVLGIGVGLAMILVFTAPAMAGPNTAYFVPQQSSADPGEITYVEVWLNITDPIGIGPTFTFEGADLDIHFDSSIGDITTVTWMPGTSTIWDAYREKHRYGDTWWLGVGSAAWGEEEPYGLGPGVYPVVNLTIESNNTGVMDIHFDHATPRVCDMFDAIGQPYPNQTWIDGMFTYTGEEETFSKELFEGWSLISMPLTADNMEVASVFASVSGNYSAIHRYDAETKHFVVLSADDVLEYGVGYFIYMTSADTWTYKGTAYSSMSIGLEQGLNMVGWLNCTKDISDALSSIAGKYRYAARWNSTMDKYEVYVPNAPAEFNDFDTMEQGRGYFISMKADGKTLSGVC